MNIPLQRRMAFVFMVWLPFSQSSFAADTSAKSTTSSTSPSFTPLSFAQNAVICPLCALIAIMVYRLESKGRCENVSYDFDTLMRGTDGYLAKSKKLLSWIDRYAIGQPYKSSSVKVKDGSLVVSDAQEPLGLMGIAQSNIKSIIISLGSSRFLYKLYRGDSDLFDKGNTLESLAWLLLSGWLLNRPSNTSSHTPTNTPTNNLNNSPSNAPSDAQNK
jgi:hypothetical protein